ncbi:MAG TPA: hypothetical protein ENL21_08690 [Caldithrix abyssi]|uniref:Uncharacterized protein n=1 Tax=Caldithrix abyssi TaxID=187145 RepID=A0A7V5H4W4_CALAY|nr:hypothetical protein [Caldisericaceae bacterium]HHE55845.1 hypothetical protein [Caldithrix abyssi]
MWTLFAIEEMSEKSYQALKAIKQKVEKDWLQIPGVTAVGIGKTESGEAGIIVSVTELSLEVQSSIPSQVEGVPVEIKFTGPIQAL